MLRLSTWWLKTSLPVISQSGSLSYTPRYKPPLKVDLSQKYDVVTEQTRFEGLDILLSRLSRHVGRRQYKMQNDLRGKYFEKLKELGLDWHDIKALDRTALTELLQKLEMNAAEKIIFMTAIHVKACGVLVRGSHRQSKAICMREGFAEHGFRCGVGSHTSDVYFERKPKANAASVVARRIQTHSFLSPTRVETEIRPMPDFHIEGRLVHDSHPRIWSRPSDPFFTVFTIGYDFLVHPDDPRAKPQIEEAYEEWNLHAEAIRNVVWEMLEGHAVQKGSQPLAVVPGDFGPEDAEIDSLRQMFLGTTRTGLKKKKGLVEGEEVSEAQKLKEKKPEPDVVVEHLMRDENTGREYPWFTPLDPRPLANGVPAHIPFAPSIAVRCTFRRPSHANPLTEAELRSPVVELSVLTHPKAPFEWPSEETQKTATDHILSFAKRVPFALPFVLYFRVDLAATCREKGFLSLRERLYSEKEHHFDLRRYRKMRKTETGDVAEEETEETLTFDVTTEADELEMPPAWNKEDR